MHFALDENTQLVLDSGCGAGTFLVRAYKFLKQFNPTLTHEELLERLWGIEIAAVSCFSCNNESFTSEILKTIHNYPVIIRNDFSESKKYFI